MSYDVIVVGNGSIGSAITHAINELDSNLNIAIVGDPTRKGAASVAAGAMLGAYGEVTAAGLKSEAGRAKIQEGIDAGKAWDSWIESINEKATSENAISKRKGTYIILNSAGGEQDTDNYYAILDTLKKNNEDHEEIDAREIEGLNAWPMKRALRAINIPNESSMESDRLLSAYDDIFERAANITFIGDHVTGLKVTGDKISGIETAENGLLEADSVVIAAGVGTQNILNTLPEVARRIPRIFPGGGTSLLVNPEWVYGTETAAVVPHVVRTPNRSFACGLHMIPRGDKNVYIGGTNYLSFEPWYEPNMSDQQFLVECATEQLNQDFVWSKIIKTQVGNRPVSADGFPLVGKTSVKGLSIVSGTFRDGLHMSPVFAQQIAREIVLDEACVNELFQPERELIQAFTREEWISEVCKNVDAALWEHAAVGATKTGFHAALPKMFEITTAMILDMMGDDYILPPEFYPLITLAPEKSIPYFIEYFNEIKNAHR